MMLETYAMQAGLIELQTGLTAVTMGP